MRLILLPGLDGTGNLFEQFVSLLPEDFSATIISYPTHEKLDYAQLEILVRNQLPKAELFVLIAESFSGAIAVSIAAEAPQNLTALVLCASFVSNPAPLILQWINHKFWFGLPTPIWLVRMLTGLHDCEDFVIQKLIKSVSSVSPEVMSFRLDQILTLDVREELRLCKIPLLLLRPKHDYYVSQKIGVDEILQIKPDARCVEIDASHFVCQHKPQESVSAIVDFLKAQRIGTRGQRDKEQEK
jgi:pimeloyl-[acyl-carrier protein] methyl ester esterase